MSSTSPRTHRISTNVIAACLASFAAYVPIVALVAALPTIGASLHTSSSDLTWVLDAFTVPVAALILSAGTLSDLFGRRRLMIVGLLLVIVGSGVGLGSGSSIGLVWTAQAITGAGAAILLPSSLAIIAHVIPDHARRAPAVGAYASALMLGLAAGPFLATLVVDTIGADWQWIYAALLPWPIIALVVTVLGVDESTSAEGRGFDLGGQLAAMAFVTALVYGVIQGPGHGWGSTLVLVSFAVAAVGLVALLVVERRATTPMLPPRLFESPAFAATGVIAAMVMVGLLGAFFLLTLYFGSAQHLGIGQIALRLLALLGVIILTAPAFSQLAHRHGARPILTAGLLVTAGGILSLTGLHLTSSYWSVAWRMALIGLGMGAVFAPMTAAAIAAVPHDLAGMAGSANSALRQLGGGLGPAALGAVLTSQVTSHIGPQLRQHHVTGPLADRVQQVVHTDGIGAIGAVAAGPHRSAIVSAAGEAFISALHTSALIAAIAMALAGVVALVVLRRRAATSDDTGPEQLLPGTLSPPREAGRVRLGTGQVARTEKTVDATHPKGL